MLPTLARCAHTFREIGNLQRASTLADEFLAQVKRGRNLAAGLRGVHVMAWTLAALGRGRELIEVLPKSDTPWVRAAAAFAAGELPRAADICGAMGALSEEARDRLWLAEALIYEHRRPEADVEAHRALTFYRSVGATRYIREAEDLLKA